jgi:hypothetical protein
MTICEKCGKPVRYIAAARSVSPDGIFMVDPVPKTLVNENGRILTGFRVHECAENKVAGPNGENDSIRIQ